MTPKSLFTSCLVRKLANGFFSLYLWFIFSNTKFVEWCWLIVSLWSLMWICLFLLCLFSFFCNPSPKMRGIGSVTAGNPDAKRLYDDLLSNYNKLVRPVVNVSDALMVKIKLKLSQLIDVNLKNQIMTTNLWVEQSWYDYKLKWEPREYGGVEMLHVPSDHIWRPDIVVRRWKFDNFALTLIIVAQHFCSRFFLCEIVFFPSFPLYLNTMWHQKSCITSKCWWWFF